MLQDTKINNKTVVVVSQPESELQFSEEFMAMVHDQVYETLRAYLENSKQDGAVQLLDDLVILSMQNTGSAELYVKNMMMSEAIGHASHHLLSLGGSWGK